MIANIDLSNMTKGSILKKNFGSPYPPPPCQKCVQLRHYCFVCDILVLVLLYCSFQAKLLDSLLREVTMGEPK